MSTVWDDLDGWADALLVDTDDEAARKLASICADLAVAVEELTALVNRLTNVPDTDLVAQLHRARGIAVALQDSLGDAEYGFRTHRR